MKTRSVCLTSFCLLALLATTVFASETEDSSKISAFAGNYTGTMTMISTDGFSTTVAANGVLKASKTREFGRLTLKYVVDNSNIGGAIVALDYGLTFDKRKLSFRTLITPSGLTPTELMAKGTASIGSKSIRYSLQLEQAGNQSTLKGAIKLTRNGIRITETITTVGAFPVSSTRDFVLKRKK